MKTHRSEKDTLEAQRFQTCMYQKPTLQANHKPRPYFWNENPNTPKECGSHNSHPH